MCNCSRMAARSPMAASKVTRLHNRFVLRQESRVYEGDLEQQNNSKYEQNRPDTNHKTILTIAKGERERDTEWGRAKKVRCSNYLSVEKQVNR